MPFVKGISGNKNGRPKGKKQKPIKPLVEKLLEKSFPTIEKDMKNNPELRRTFFTDLTKIILTVNN